MNNEAAPEQGITLADAARFLMSMTGSHGWQRILKPFMEGEIRKITNEMIMEPDLIKDPDRRGMIKAYGTLLSWESRGQAIAEQLYRAVGTPPPPPDEAAEARGTIYGK